MGASFPGVATRNPPTTPPAPQVRDEIRRRLLDVAGDRIVAVYLHGSRAKGTARPRSDWDVVVVLRDPVDDWIDEGLRLAALFYDSPFAVDLQTYGEREFRDDAEVPGTPELGEHDVEPALPDEARSRIAAEAGAETAPVEAVARCLPRALGRLEPLDAETSRLVGSTSNLAWYVEQLTAIPASYRIVTCAESESDAS